MIRNLLSDEEWSFFKPFVASDSPLGGRPARGHGRVLDAISWIARTGAPWRDLPAGLGSWNSVFRQFRRWTASGLWDVMLEALADGGGEADLLQMIDSTSVRAHRCAAGRRGGGDASPGSWARARWLHEQAPHPRQRAWPAHRPARDHRPGSRLLELRRADGGARQRPHPPGPARPWRRAGDPDQAEPPYPAQRQPPLYALRSRIECFINRLKNSRRVATRYDQTADSFLGFAALASIRLWIRLARAV